MAVDGEGERVSFTFPWISRGGRTEFKFDARDSVDMAASYERFLENEHGVRQDEITFMLTPIYGKLHACLVMMVMEEDPPYQFVGYAELINE